MLAPQTQPQIRVEFVGGPFDGHTQSISASAEDLALTAALPVNENVFRMLDGKLRGTAQPTRTVALYELRWAAGWQYHFLGSRRPAEFNLESWRV